MGGGGVGGEAGRAKYFFKQEKNAKEQETKHPCFVFLGSPHTSGEQ